MTATIQSTVAIENALRCLQAAQEKIDTEFGLDEGTNTFRRELPQWAVLLMGNIHAAKGHLKNTLKFDIVQGEDE